MALTLPGHSAPAVGFEVPLEMLSSRPGPDRWLRRAVRRFGARCCHSKDAAKS